MYTLQVCSCRQEKDYTYMHGLMVVWKETKKHSDRKTRTTHDFYSRMHGKYIIFPRTYIFSHTYNIAQETVRIHFSTNISNHIKNIHWPVFY